MVMSTSIVLCLILSIASVTVSVNCNRNYTVQAGDICDGISANQKVSTYQLASANVQVINNQCSNLATGMNLCLGWAGYDCTNVVIVTAGDSCASIIAAANISSSILMKNNPQINADCSNLYSGEALCVDSQINVNPYPSGSPVSVNWQATSAPTSAAATPTKAVDAVTTNSSSSTASAAIATFYAANDAAAVGIDYNTLPYCDETW